MGFGVEWQDGIFYSYEGKSLIVAIFSKYNYFRTMRDHLLWSNETKVASSALNTTQKQLSTIPQ